MKNPHEKPLYSSQFEEKSKCLAPWASHVCTAASHITCQKNITQGI